MGQSLVRIRTKNRHHNVPKPERTKRYYRRLRSRIEAKRAAREIEHDLRAVKFHF